MADLTREQRHWQHALDNGAFGVWDLDLLRDAVHYSPAWKARLGFPRLQSADATGFWRCRVHPSDFTPMLDAQRHHIDGHAATYEMRFRLRSNGSGYRTMLSCGRVVARDAHGRPTRMVGTMIDLTARPVSPSTRGLPAEDPQAVEAWAHLPFHATLDRPDAMPLIDQVHDLLARAARDGRAHGAPAHAAAG